MKNNPHKAVIIWLLSGCFLVMAMVIIGGITRLTGSGLSMVEWNVIMGAIPPLTEQEWQGAFEQYKQFPEYAYVNYNFTLKDFKSIFFWEYLHRLIGRFIGIVFLVPFIYFWWKKRFDKSLLLKLLIILALGAFQGVLGWYMVKSGLVDNPDVSHYRLAAHLVAAFSVYAYTLWVALDLLYYSYKKNPIILSIQKLTMVFAALVIVQIIYGAFVAGLDAGKIYNTFPKMGDEWFPESVVAMKPFYLNFLESLSGVQFIHRCLAYIIFFFAITLWYKSRVLNLLPNQKMGFNLLLIVVCIQAILGVLTLLYAVPIALGVLHQFGALMLLTAVVYLLHQLNVSEKQKEFAL